MNDLFNILIFSKDYNQGVIIQDYIKAIGYNSQVFDQEEAAYEGFLSRNFTLCIINHDIDTKETRTLAAMIKSSENIIPVVFLCEHPTRESSTKPLPAPTQERGQDLYFRKIQIRLAKTDLVHRRQNNQADNQRGRFAYVAVPTRKQYGRQDARPADHMEKR